MRQPFQSPLGGWVIRTGITSFIFCSALGHAQNLEKNALAQAIEEVVITGSRLARNGYDTPSPLSSLGFEEIETQAPQNIADLVNELPSVTGSQTGSTNSGSLATGNAGISALNLRALGADRTLVLLDGRRSPSSSSAGLVDVNTMPQGLIERVEIVTGGASAVYGSGAVGGVINFILDKDFTGLKSSVSYGQTEHGDNESKKFGLTGGTTFAEGRGHLLFDAEKSDVDGVHETVRSWNKRGHFAIPNPNAKTPGASAYIVADHVGLSGHTPGGLIVSGPLRGTYFDAGGEVKQLNYGEVGGQWMQGGDWQYTSHLAGTNSLVAEEARDSLFGRVSFELTPSLELFGEVSYAGFEGFAHYMRVESLRVPIQRDNAFLPAEVATAMDAAGVSSFQLSTTNADAGISGHSNERETLRYTVGLNGLFDLFGREGGWDASYQKAVTEADQLYLPTIYHEQRLTLATDAVLHPVTGEPVCRSSLTDPANGCVPLNRFGIGVSDPAAWAYVSGAPRRVETYDLDVAAVNFRLGDLPGWAGPVNVAFGGEWRKEGISGEVEEQYRQGWRFGNFQEDKGDFDVIESYFETLVPLVFGIDFNGAVRVADYSTSRAVTPWKLGLTFSPVGAVMLRATRSRDIRAPNLGELFATLT